MTFSPLASPVHVVGGSHPQMAQPSKVMNLLPRPLDNEGLILDHIGSLASSKETPESYPAASKSGMNPLPLLIVIHDLTFLCLKHILPVSDLFQMSAGRCLSL